MPLERIRKLRKPFALGRRAHYWLLASGALLVWGGMVLALVLSSCKTAAPQAGLGLAGNAPAVPAVGLQVPGGDAAPMPMAPAGATPQVKRPYRIGPGDKIKVDAWNADDVFNQMHTVGPDGAITIPLYGVVDVEGKTRQELAEQLNAILSQDYRNPKITITVLEYNNARFYVFGEVTRPGAHSFTGSPYLLEAINLAGGFTQTADLANCSVVRGNNNLVRVDLMQLFRGGDRGLNVEIGVGDVVYVPRNSERVVHVMGEVNRPGIFPIPYGEDMSLVTAILQAGSYTKDAALGSVHIVRGDPAHPQFITVSLSEVLSGQGGNIALVPGDVVFVSTRTLAKINYFISQVTPALSSVFFADSVNRAVQNFGATGTTK